MAAVRFHLPGLRYNFPLNMVFNSLLKSHREYFREGVEIGSFFGCFPTALWNGGRFIPNDQCDSKFVKSVIKSINAEGIPIRYTFTNPLITEKDLSDPYCNFCMEAADNGMNEVIVFSPILEQYIREKYPSYKINSTICKQIRTPEELNAELEKDYQYVVLDYNYNNKFEILDKLNHPEKLEILTQTLCTPNCPRRTEHFQQISKDQRTVLENRNLPPEKRKPIMGWQCVYGETGSLHSVMKSPTFVSPESIWNEYVPRGITNFKIEGRTANLFSLVDYYTYFMCKPEYAGLARLTILKTLQQGGIVNVNSPRPSTWL